MSNETNKDFEFFSPPITSCSDWDEIDAVIQGKLAVCFRLKVSPKEALRSFFSDCKKNKVELLLSISEYFHVKSESPMYCVEVIESEMTFWAASFDELHEAVAFSNSLLRNADEQPYTFLDLNKEDFDRIIYNGEDIGFYKKYTY